ncbi:MULTISPECIES: D-xylose transporter XylE [Vibrio harveyi group]|uniref:D-xylose transporter XylE n=1 Tax=Vibrio harveyi group TaxID=717610 RepID=UPI001B833168|nr:MULTISPECIES: D-xylose transporter XylE [Vibrio harveyi group]MCR9881974.1 D-xylose transporter XylE [Vibrio parahaemolyticus]MCR9896646.1 D-xylose transporter XylE [Vibrio parahaemolyticus]MCZ6400040.1 D-xylose transporter XylE [Vibrio alginolyticus]HBC3402634.1 D-xylose transporter XylE [Vibrio parahaemolyticus]HBH7870938.1 D-xylose transporter XylE [Vibrio parahaemolyticus]
MYNTKSITQITIVVALGGLLFGYDTAVISGATEALQYFFNLSPAELGFAASSALIGCVIGSIVAGPVSTKYGRKKSLILAAVLFFISAFGSALPETLNFIAGTTYSSFIVYRILGGIGVGIASMVSPMYIAEVAPPSKRGSLVSCNQFAIIFGMLIVYFVNYGIALLGSDEWLFSIGWRYMFASECLPAGIFFILLFGVPETPRWLAMNGYFQDARNLIASFNKGDDFDKQWEEIKSSLNDKAKNVSVFSHGIFFILLLGITLSVLQQVTGINVFLYYAPVIFKSFSSSSTDVAMLQTILVGAVNLLFTVIAIYSVDKFGRKPLMMIGAAAMAISMLAIGTAAYLDAIGGYLIIFVLMYIAAFALSLGPVTWVLLSEMFPNAVRSKALSIAVFAQWFANYAVSQTFPMMNAKDSFLYQEFHGGFPFWLYGAMAVLTVYFIYRWIPETKGKSLEELEKLWDQKGEEKDLTVSSANS